VLSIFVTGQLAPLQLARANARSGNMGAARTDYQNFLALGKMPILIVQS
jgi:hypothetical protein